MNLNNPNANIDRRRLADQLAQEAPTSGARTHGPPTKRSKPEPTMTITSNELMSGERIKELVESNEDSQLKLNPDRWSDYDYMQQAITNTADLSDEEDTKTLLQKMYKLQCFREEYRIQDTVEEGVRLIQQLMEMMPGYVLSVDFAPRYGSYIAVFDYAAFRPERLRMNESLRVFLGASYYIFQCLSTNLKAVRSGAVFITECQDMQNENFNQQVEEKYIHHLFGHYPFRHKECLWLNTPTIANIAYGLLKSQMPQGFLATWRMGCKLDGYEGRIDSLFKMPTLALAQEQLLVRIQGYLKERGQNAGGFEMHKRMVYNPPPPPPAAARQAAAANQQAAAAAARQGPRPGAPQGPRPAQQVRPGAHPQGPRPAHSRPGVQPPGPRPAAAAQAARAGYPQGPPPAAAAHAARAGYPQGPRPAGAPYPARTQGPRPAHQVRPAAHPQGARPAAHPARFAAHPQAHHPVGAAPAPATARQRVAPRAPPQPPQSVAQGRRSPDVVSAPPGRASDASTQA